MTKQIEISIDDPVTTTAERFVEVWNRVESGEELEAERRIVFENPETLFKTLTLERWTLWNAF